MGVYVPDVVSTRGREMRRLLIVGGLCALLGSCQSTDQFGLRTMVGGGTSELRVDRDSGDGSHQTARIEVTNSPADLGDMEVGIRLLGGFHDFDDSDGAATVDLEMTDVGGVIVIRPYLPVSERVQLYLEGFAGYQHSWSDLSVDNGMGGIFEEKGHDGGFLYGGGCGAEFALDEYNSLIFGVEWSRHLTEDNFKLRVDDLTALVGWSISF